jgi:hypothetical protein
MPKGTTDLQGTEFIKTAKASARQALYGHHFDRVLTAQDYSGCVFSVHTT